MTDEKIQDLEKAVLDMEEYCNKGFGKIIDSHGLEGALIALVNLSTGFAAKALVMTPEGGREHLLFTLQSMIDSRTNEGDAVIESSMAITKAMGSTCRPH